jgi:hypothetical protein
MTMEATIYHIAHSMMTDDMSIYVCTDSSTMKYVSQYVLCTLGQDQLRSTELDKSIYYKCITDLSYKLFPLGCYL